MNGLKVPDSCWLHPHIEKRWINYKSGFGLFANAKIKKGETATTCSGRIISKAELISASPIIQKLVKTYGFDIDDYYLLIPEESAHLSDVWVLNHSCDPNLGNLGPFTTVAIRDIESDEQVTIDYATIDTDECQEHEGMTCFCASLNCRGIITGDDWMLPELQEKYKGYFQPHIQRKIDELKQIPS